MARQDIERAIRVRDNSRCSALSVSPIDGGGEIARRFSRDAIRKTCDELRRRIEVNDGGFAGVELAAKADDIREIIAGDDARVGEVTLGPSTADTFSEIPHDRSEIVAIDEPIQIGIAVLVIGDNNRVSVNGWAGNVRKGLP